jgi:putative membrane protein
MNISDSNLRIGVGAVTILIPTVVTLLAYIKLDIENVEFVYNLPALNAILNGTAFFTLIAAWFAIKKKEVSLHKRLTSLAVILSVLFLISYITFHLLTDPTKLPAEVQGIERNAYYFILLTHIVLSAFIVPLVLFTYVRGYKMEVEKHRKLAKITWPLWLYVTATGVVVYLMISPYYNF